MDNNHKLNIKIKWAYRSPKERHATNELIKENHKQMSTTELGKLTGLSWKTTNNILTELKLTPKRTKTKPTKKELEKALVKYKEMINNGESVTNARKTTGVSSGQAAKWNKDRINGLWEN